MRKIILLACLILVGCKGGTSSSGSSSSGVSANGGTTATVAVADGKIQLTWTAASGSPTGYHVEQSTDGTHFSMVQTVSSASALITGASHGQTYYFRVRAYNSGGYSAYTPAVSVTP